MSKSFWSLCLLSTALLVGCDQGELPPAADAGGPKDAAAATQGMQDAMNSPNVPPHMKEMMEKRQQQMQKKTP